MERKGCLSDFWRIDASDDRVMELASVLQGADSLIGVMGSGVRVVWSTNGQSETWWVRTKQGKPIESRVFLDYSPLRELESPFRGRAVDEVIGYAAHEGGHCLWSAPDARDAVITTLDRRPSGRLAAKDREKVEEVLRVANILEDAYIDFHVSEEWPVLGEYIHWARQQCGRARPIDLDAIARQARPARNSVMNLWIACSLYDHELPKRMSARVRKAMNFLMSKSVEAVRTQQVYVRLELAVDCWEYLVKEFPTKDEPLPRQPQPQQGAGAQGGGKGEAQEAQEGGEAGSGEGEGGQAKAKAEAKGDQDTEQDGQGGGEGEPKGEEEDVSTGEPEGDEGQEFGHFGGEEAEQEGEGAQDDEGGEQDGGEEASRQEPSRSERGGDEAGSPGNLDEFDIRDLEEMPEEILNEVLDAIVHELEDLSRSVAEVITKPYGDVNAQTKKADFDGPAAARVRNQVEKEIQEIQRVFDKQAAVKSRQLHGLTTGKLDTRRLARVGTGNLRVFKRREVLEQPDLAVGLLLDVSGSMHSNMGVVWMTAAVFSEGLVRKRGINFLCLTYTGGYFNVQTTKICDREMGKLCLGNVEQGGGTPSGPAIASMKVLMDRMPERQKVIIHFTDGAPDDYSHYGRTSPAVEAAVDACRKAGYRVWALAPKGCEAMLQSQYGDGTWETIGTIHELPAKVTALVKTLVAK